MDLQHAARRITWVLFLAQGLGSAGLIAASTVGSIVGARLGGGPAWGGVPSAVSLLGSALSALVWGLLIGRGSWRGGLLAGAGLGIVGAVLAAGAITLGSLPAFLVGCALLGTTQSALQLSRFASAEVHPPEERGRAISNVVLGGTVGAVFGPLLVGPVGRLALGAGLDELSGPYAVTLGLCLLVGLLLFIGLRPDPHTLGLAVRRLNPQEAAAAGSARPLLEILSQPGPRLALASMTLGQIVMVMVMVITALHMRGHNHALGSVSLVISSHTFGMFAFSVVSGRLADRLGRGPVILVGAGTLVLSCLLAPLSPQVLPLAVALFLLGLGWNFCFVAGSSLLADHLRPSERSRVQGFNDLLIGLASAAGSLGSGLVFAALGYTVMSLTGAATAALLVGLALRWRFLRRGATAGVA